MLHQEDLTYLGELLARVGDSDNGAKRELGQRAKVDMGWDAALIGANQAVNGDDVRVGENVSAKEWLCALFCSGEEIMLNHLKLTLTFVNENTHSGDILAGLPYVSGASGWDGAPENLRVFFASMEQPLLEEDTQIKAAIDVQGHIIFGLGEDERAWASLGFTETYAAPEVLVDSVPSEEAALYIMKVADELKQDRTFVQHGRVLPGFCLIRGPDGEMRSGPAAFRRLRRPEMLFRADALYGSGCYRAVQLVLCDPEGKLPWEDDVAEMNQRKFWTD